MMGKCVGCGKKTGFLGTSLCKVCQKKSNKSLKAAINRQGRKQRRK